MSKISKVVIAGRDASAWLAANALMRAFGRTGLKVEVVELPSLLRAQDVLTSLPALEALHRLLGFDEYAILKAASGTYSLGQSFANFSGAAAPFFHPYGAHGVGIGRHPFMPFWIRARQSGMNVALEDFSLTAAAAKQGRFFLPNDETRLFDPCDYAYHLKAAPYVQYLKAQALRRGVEVQAARLIDAKLDEETGHITGLVTGDGREITGDLFIDATGAESLLLGGALKVPFESWADNFPGNRVLAVSGERLKTLPPYSQVRALSKSCLHLAPLQDRTCLLHVYHDAEMPDQEALETAAVISNLRLGSDAVVSALNIGRRVRTWEKNCIAIGEAACVLDPIDNASLQVVQLGLAHLIDLFPIDEHQSNEAAEYNEQVGTGQVRIRDFQLAHYKLNRIDNEPLWNRLRDMPVPDTLAYKIELFKSRGTVALYEDETFLLDSWLAIFTGHGLMPRSYDPVIDMVPQDEVIRNFQGALGFIKKQVQDMSSHDAFIETYAAKDFA